jgi:hypothetical protein
MRNITYETVLRHPELLEELKQAARRERSAAIGEFVRRLFKFSGSTESRPAVRPAATNTALCSRVA